MNAYEETSTDVLAGRLQGVSAHVGRKDRATVQEAIKVIQWLAQLLHDERRTHAATIQLLNRRITRLSRPPSSFSIVRTPADGQEEVITAPPPESPDRPADDA